MSKCSEWKSRGSFLSGRVHTLHTIQRLILCTRSVFVCVFAGINVCFTIQSNHGNLNETLYLVNKTFYLFYFILVPIHSQPQSDASLCLRILLIVHQSFSSWCFSLFLFVCSWVIVCVFAVSHFHSLLLKLIPMRIFSLLCASFKSKTD